MKDLQIIFMGTPDFAVETLKMIIAHNYQVVGVITAPDKPAGRGRKLKISAVKKYALSQNLTVLQPTNLKDKNFVTTLENLNADLNIVVAFRMLPKVVWDMPAYGTFNLHASLLPQYRGAAPINWAIINGETATGITTFFIDEKIDTGRIIMQKEVIIKKEDTAGILHDKLMIDGAHLVIKTIKKIANNTLKTTIQPKENVLKTAYKLNRDNTKINWGDTIQKIYNLIRGLSPYPTAWCYLYNKEKEIKIKIYKASIEVETHTYNAGTIIIKDATIKIAVNNGYILIHNIQLPGKKAMDTKSLLNGYTFDKDAKMH